MREARVQMAGGNALARRSEKHRIKIWILHTHCYSEAQAGDVNILTDSDCTKFMRSIESNNEGGGRGKRARMKESTAEHLHGLVSKGGNTVGVVCQRGPQHVCSSSSLLNKASHNRCGFDQDTQYIFLMWGYHHLLCAQQVYLCSYVNFFWVFNQVCWK